MHIAAFFVGVTLCNSIPHLTSGLRGETFPTPFAKPRGKGPSSPLVNFLWGMANLLLGISLLSQYPVTVGANAEFMLLVIGALAIGTYLSIHFGKHRVIR